MIICICNNISDRKIKNAVIKHEDVHEIQDLQKYLKVCDSCHGCTQMIHTIIQQIDGGRLK